MTCKDCICSEVCYYKSFNDVRNLKKRRDDVEKICKSFVHRESVKVVEIDHVKKQNTVDAVEVVHGRWEDMFGGKYANPRFRCSACNEKALYKFKKNGLDQWEKVQALTPYCSNCGAMLDGGSDNDV